MDTTATGLGVDPAIIVPLIPSSPPTAAIATTSTSDNKTSGNGNIVVGNANDAKEYKSNGIIPKTTTNDATTTTTTATAATTAGGGGVVTTAGTKVKASRRGGGGGGKAQTRAPLISASEKDPTKLTSFGMRSSATLQGGGILSKLFGADAERKRRGSTVILIYHFTKDLY
jgi:hypothetical protein